MLQVTKQLFPGLPSRMASRLVPVKHPSEVQRILMTEVREILERISQTEVDPTLRDPDAKALDREEEFCEPEKPRQRRSEGRQRPS
jgi:hypothetical protein